MSNGERFEMFAEIINNLTKAYRSRYEAFSVCASCIGKVEDLENLEEGKYYEDGQRNKRHIDGKNSTEEGYNMTATWSSLVVVDGFVHRVSIISYTRQACSAAFTKDAVILSSQLDLTQRCCEQWNGDYSYETFWLDHDMQIHKSKTEMGKTHPLVRKTDPNSEKLEWACCQ